MKLQIAVASLAFPLLAFGPPLAAGCHVPASQVATDIQAGEAVVCPKLTSIPYGAQICEAVAELVASFIRAFAASSPENRALVERAKASLLDESVKLVRVGSYGFVPEPLASKLNQPATRKALDAWVATGQARLDAGADR